MSTTLCHIRESQEYLDRRRDVDGHFHYIEDANW
jgi:hypothetical protein